MTIKHVQETLGQFNDWKYFSLLESKQKEKNKKIDKNTSNEIDESTSDEDEKFKEEDEKDGINIIQKLKDNLNRFQSAAGEKILKYKEFWEENQQATDGFDEEGELYKLWDSNYVAGVLNLPDEALSDEELTAEIELVDSKIDDEEKEDDEDKKKEDDEEDKEKEDNDEDKEKEDDEEDKEKKDEKEDKEKKDEKVNEAEKPKGEDFDLENKEGESSEEKETKTKEPTLGFEPEEETKDEFAADDEVEVEDGEAIELEGDLDADGKVEGGMEFADEGISEYFVVYDMNGTERDEIFRTDSPKVIEEFRNFFENEFKATIKEQIQTFKQAQEEKKEEEERIAKEEIRKARKGKLEKFMKD